MIQPQVIDGIKCYAPEFAFHNENYSPEIFDRLFRAEQRNFWFRSRNRIIQRLVKKLCKDKERFDFLEIGCGTGYVLSGLSKIPNIKLEGAEIFLDGLKYTKSRVPDIELMQLDATKMPFESKYDAIGAFDVIEHIDEDELVMNQVWKALKPGGHFLISVPQYQWMWSYLDDMAHHKRRYTKRELKNKLRAVGFEVAHLTSFVFSLFPLMVLSRLFKRGKNINYDLDMQMKELELGTISSKVLEIFMRFDEMLMKAGLRLPYGGSLIVVARKKNNAE